MNSPDAMCERCDGLCCRMYDIFDTESSKLVKWAWEKCGYLDINNRCRIYTTRIKHRGYRDSCDLYHCEWGGPIVTIFARRIPIEYEKRSGIISSLLEVIRLRIELSPESKGTILQFTAELLNDICIDKNLLLSVKVVRVKIERWEEG